MKSRESDVFIVSAAVLAVALMAMAGVPVGDADAESDGITIISRGNVVQDKTIEYMDGYKVDDDYYIAQGKTLKFVNGAFLAADAGKTLTLRDGAKIQMLGPGMTFIASGEVKMGFLTAFESNDIKSLRISGTGTLKFEGSSGFQVLAGQTLTIEAGFEGDVRILYAEKAKNASNMVISGDGSYTGTLTCGRMDGNAFTRIATASARGLGSAGELKVAAAGDGFDLGGSMSGTIGDMDLRIRNELSLNGAVLECDAVVELGAKLVLDGAAEMQAGRTLELAATDGSAHAYLEAGTAGSALVLNDGSRLVMNDAGTVFASSGTVSMGFAQTFVRSNISWIDTSGEGTLLMEEGTLTVPNGESIAIGTAFEGPISLGWGSSLAISSEGRYSGRLAYGVVGEKGFTEVGALEVRGMTGSEGGAVIGTSPAEKTVSLKGSSAVVPGGGVSVDPGTEVRIPEGSMFVVGTGATVIVSEGSAVRTSGSGRVAIDPGAEVDVYGVFDAGTDNSGIIAVYTGGEVSESKISELGDGRIVERTLPDRGDDEIDTEKDDKTYAYLTAIIIALIVAAIVLVKRRH